MKAIIPAAGLGTRFLPATKAQPKEMLPIVDKPVIQYVVEEVVASGIKDILIITGRGKRAIEDHFDKSYELEENLKRNGKTKLLEKVKNISGLANIHYVRQKEQKGLGDAIYCAKQYVENGPFAVLLGDDIIVSKVPIIKQMTRLYNKYKSPIIGIEKVPKKNISRYGIIKGKKISEKIFLVEDLIEKPSVKEAPSNLGIIGRYILTSDIFEAIEKTKPGVGGEIQLTDALKLLNNKVYAYQFQGKRYDTGTIPDWIKLNIIFAKQRKML